MIIRRAAVLICLLLAGCAGEFESGSCELIPGTEKADASDAVSVAPDGHWLVFREYDPVSMTYSVASLDLRTDALTRHRLVEGSSMKGLGTGGQTFRDLPFDRVAWKDGLFWGVLEMGNPGRPIVLDPEQPEMRFAETKRFPRLRTVAALDRPNNDVLGDWLARKRRGCRDGNNPAHIASLRHFNWSIPMADGQPTDVIYLSEGREVVRIDPGCDRTVVARTRDSAMNKKSIFLVAVSADERYFAYGEVLWARYAPIGGHTGDEVHVVDLRTGERKLVMRAARVGSLIWLADGHTLVFNAEGRRSGLFRLDARRIFE